MVGYDENCLKMHSEPDRPSQRHLLFPAAAGRAATCLAGGIAAWLTVTVSDAVRDSRPRDFLKERCSLLWQKTAKVKDNGARYGWEVL